MLVPHTHTHAHAHVSERTFAVIPGGRRKRKNSEAGDDGKAYDGARVVNRGKRRRVGQTVLTGCVCVCVFFFDLRLTCFLHQAIRGRKKRRTAVPCPREYIGSDTTEEGGGSESDVYTPSVGAAGGGFLDRRKALCNCVCLCT